MGCDIFNWVEVYDPLTDQWRAVRDVFPGSEFLKRHFGKEFVSSPFLYRDYGLFGFLADVRNYHCCTPIAAPRGLPADCDLAGGCAAINELELFEECHVQIGRLIRNFHSHSWLLLSELLEFDYETVFWDRRIERGAVGAALAEEGEGVHVTYREFLGPNFFAALDIMKGLGAEPGRIRVVFCFGD